MHRGLVAGIALALLSGCAGQPYHVPPKHILAPSENPAKTLDYSASQGQTVVAKFIAAYDDSYKHEIEPSKARALTRYGMTLVDTRCDLFFEQIGRGAQTGDFVRREFQSITAALVAVLGLSGAGKNAVTGVGIGNALGIQTIDNYSNVYFFSPDVSAVQKLVRRVLLSQRSEMLAPERSPKSYDDAINALRIYQNICTAHEIKRLVTEAIDPDRPAISRFGEEPTLIYSAAAGRALKSISDAFATDNVDLRQAVLIEMLREQPPVLTTPKENYACYALSERVRVTVCESAEMAARKDDKLRETDTWTVSKTALPTPTEKALDAGIATLKALMPREYDQMRTVQTAAIGESASEYIKKIAVLRTAEATDSKNAARIATLQEQVRQTSVRSIEAGRTITDTPAVKVPDTPAAPVQTAPGAGS